MSISNLTPLLIRLVESLEYRTIARQLALPRGAIATRVATYFRKQGVAVGRSLAMDRLTEAALDAMSGAESFDQALEDTDHSNVDRALSVAFLAAMLWSNRQYALGLDVGTLTMGHTRVVAYQEGRGAELARLLNQTTRRDIDAILADNGSTPTEKARAIRKLFVSYATKRAEGVAAHEAALAHNAGTFGTILEANPGGLAFEKSWLTANDERVEEECLSNQDQGWIAMGSQHTSGALYPPEHPNCRCFEVYRRLR